MNLFKNILLEMKLLKEEASVESINDSITNMHPAIISYKNNEGDKQAIGNRKIFPVAYGISTAGNPVIRAFEEEGDTTTKVPAWKLFIVPNIISWKTLDNESFENEELIGLNKNGNDKQIETLYNISPLSNNAQKWLKKEPEINSLPVSKDNITGKEKISAKDVVNDTINNVIQTKNIDNSPKNNYTNNSNLNRLEAEPETAPVTKPEIEPINNNEPTSNVVTPNAAQERMYANNEPVEKDDIENTEDNNEPEISSAYNNLMDRWKASPER